MLAARRTPQRRNETQSEWYSAVNIHKLLFITLFSFTSSKIRQCHNLMRKVLLHFCFVFLRLRFLRFAFASAHFTFFPGDTPTWARINASIICASVRRSAGVDDAADSGDIPSDINAIKLHFDYCKMSVALSLHFDGAHGEGERRRMGRRLCTEDGLSARAIIARKSAHECSARRPGAVFPLEWALSRTSKSPLGQRSPVLGILFTWS